MSPKRLSRDLRQAQSPFMTRRRGAVCLSLAAAASMGLIAAYQMGLIRRIPEPPLPGLDADKVDASEEAYEKLWTGDAFLGLTSYAATATLAAMGEPERARTKPWIPLALAGKSLADSLMAAKLTWDQWAKHRAFCSYCLIAAAATFATLPLTIGEARAALQHLIGRRPHVSRRLKVRPEIPVSV